MIIVIALVAAFLAILTWNFYIQNNSFSNINIPPSENIPYNFNDMRPITPVEVINDIEKSEVNNQPILLHFYTSWCPVCKKQFPVINEIARKFQKTDLKVLVIAIDKDITPQKVVDSLRIFPEFYFKPEYLSDRGGFKEFLSTKSINFKNRIPFTVIIDRKAAIVTQFSGYKNLNYINKKVMKSLVKENED